jgi:diadenosine tetraphosphatase ApaH/serine/threonine PP2A family protein phosphatase
MEVHRLRLLRRISGAKREEVGGGRIKLHKEEPHKLDSSRDIIRVITRRRISWTSHEARMGEMTTVNEICKGKPEGKRPLGKPKRRWEDNIKICLKEIGRDDAD